MELSLFYQNQDFHFFFWVYLDWYKVTHMGTIVPDVIAKL